MARVAQQLCLTWEAKQLPDQLVLWEKTPRKLRVRRL